jgi:choline dehydrogenase-like flavoprotein
MKIVIGSGPTGVSCAHALCNRGHDVMMLDAGITLPPSEQGLIDRVQQNDPLAFDKLIELQAHIPITAGGIARKLAYGSEFSYQETTEHLGFLPPVAGLLPSLALGGLSNVWGAAVLPYRSEDISDWPITLADLAHHYQAVLRLTGLAGQKDDLAELFPLYCDHPNSLNPSSQARYLLDGFARMKDALNGDGISVGSSRLMMGPRSTHNQECRYCGQCLYGCPYGCIYKSSESIPHLQALFPGRFRYQPDVIVENITETPGTVLISGYNRLSKAPLNFEGEKAFVAAGVIPTGRIMLKSFEAYDHPLQISDSQYFILPLISLRGSKASQEMRHTLSQLFIEIQDSKLSSHTIHLQVYTYNDFLKKILQKKLWFAPGLNRVAANFLSQRIIVIQGYLHSAHSSKMSLKLTRNSAGQEALLLESHVKVGVKALIQKIVHKLEPHFRKLGFVAISHALDITNPGRGFHSGGTFPMREKPGAWESDIMGRPFGMSNVHLVDASIFPSIPATTITLTAMANAYRIGAGLN